MALSAYVLLRAVPGKVFDVVKEAKKIPGVKSADAVSGPIDAVLHVSSGNIKTLGKLVNEKIQKIDGVRSTMTCLIA
ncbi:MAG: Lrp/AsnC ligand binding domain-containing protein [Chloroflexi bacterium]|nr:Lrp/AsnC ligand binding domain-containing protein [Chloroflexota bacterium]